MSIGSWDASLGASNWRNKRHGSVVGDPIEAWYWPLRGSVFTGPIRKYTGESRLVGGRGGVWGVGGGVWSAARRHAALGGELIAQ